MLEGESNSRREWRVGREENCRKERVGSCWEGSEERITVEGSEKREKERENIAGRGKCETDREVRVLRRVESGRGES